MVNSSNLWLQAPTTHQRGSQSRAHLWTELLEQGSGPEQWAMGLPRAFPYFLGRLKRVTSGTGSRVGVGAALGRPPLLQPGISWVTWETSVTLMPVSRFPLHVFIVLGTFYSVFIYGIQRQYFWNWYFNWKQVIWSVQWKLRPSVINKTKDHAHVRVQYSWPEQMCRTPEMEKQAAKYVQGEPAHVFSTMYLCGTGFWWGKCYYFSNIRTTK